MAVTSGAGIASSSLQEAKATVRNAIAKPWRKHMDKKQNWLMADLFEVKIRPQLLFRQ
jgi:hypothetical protein